MPRINFCHCYNVDMICQIDCGAYGAIITYVPNVGYGPSYSQPTPDIVFDRFLSRYIGKPSDSIDQFLGLTRGPRTLWSSW